MVPLLHLRRPSIQPDSVSALSETARHDPIRIGGREMAVHAHLPVSHVPLGIRLGSETDLPQDIESLSVVKPREQIWYQAGCR